MSHAVFYHPPIKNSPLTTLPLAFLHLATPLQGGRHRLELVDGRLEPDPLAALRRRLPGADALLISAMPGSQIETALEACGIAHELRPDLPVIWGGPHPSVDPERTIAHPLVSGVVVGRGEFVIEDLLDALPDPDAVVRIPNTLFKRADGTIARGPRQSFADRKPRLPDVGLLAGVEPYLCQTRRSSRMIDYISSFGCPHTCTFCSEPITSGSRWSCMDADVLVEEIIRLKHRYAVDGVLFQDAKFVTDRRRLREFCRGLIDAGAGINWIATACSTDLTGLERDGTLAMMRDAGCEQLFIGVEAASAETLRKYRKTIAGDRTLQLARLLWEKYGILPHFSYVVGYPIEDMEQVEKTLALHQAVCELVNAPTGELGIYNPVPGTALLGAHQHYFHMPDDLAGWSKFNYYSQDLYKEPSAALSRRLFQHHIKVRRMFPEVESYKTFDVWQQRPAG